VIVDSIPTVVALAFKTEARDDRLAHFPCGPLSANVESSCHDTSMALGWPNLRALAATTSVNAQLH
jgi:hypothetical protein